MAFSAEWERLYSDRCQMSIWPWSDLVSYIYRYTDVAKRPKVKVLELGCGAGANIRLFKELDADYYAIDGSVTIIEELKKKFPQYAEHIVEGDFTKNIPFAETFDVIVDRASVTHNTTKDIINTISLIKQHLTNSTGQFIGIDWFSMNHDDYCLGAVIEKDKYTKYMGDVNGQFSGVGNVHFSDEEHLKDLFHDFTIKVMEEKVLNKICPAKHKFASFNFVVTKKE